MWGGVSKKKKEWYPQTHTTINHIIVALLRRKKDWNFADRKCLPVTPTHYVFLLLQKQTEL